MSPNLQLNINTSNSKTKAKLKTKDKLEVKGKRKGKKKEKLICDINLTNKTLGKCLGFIIVSNQNKIVNSKKILLNKTYILLKDDKFPFMILGNEYNQKNINQDVINNKLSELIFHVFNVSLGKLKDIKIDNILDDSKCLLYLVHIPFNNINQRLILHQKYLRDNNSYSQYQQSFCWRVYYDLFYDIYDSLYHNILISKNNSHLSYKIKADNSDLKERILHMDFECSLNLIYLKLIKIFL